MQAILNFLCINVSSQGETYFPVYPPLEGYTGANPVYPSFAGVYWIQYITPKEYTESMLGLLAIRGWNYCHFKYIGFPGKPHSKFQGNTHQNSKNQCRTVPVSTISSVTPSTTNNPPTHQNDRTSTM